MANVTLTALLLFVFLLPGCMIAERSVVIADITKGETLILKKLPEQGHVSSIAIRGEGHIDGNAEISLILNGVPYKTEVLSGSVAFNWGGDWYADEAEIKYLPASVKAGRLTLNYKFID